MKRTGKPRKASKRSSAKSEIVAKSRSPLHRPTRKHEAASTYKRARAKTKQRKELSEE